MKTNNFDIKIRPINYFSQSRLEMTDFVPRNSKKILDIGCAEGAFGQQLKEKLNAEVWGLELDIKAANIAKKKLDKVIMGDISQFTNTIPNKYFDCIIFNDILEHLYDPYKVLLDIKRCLSPNGVVVSSIPNIRHFRVLKKLLIKKLWEYKDDGILDKSHLRFFTKKSIINMFNSLGYKLLKIEGINPTTSLEFKLLNILLLGYLSDAKYSQFACIAKPV